MINIRYTLAAAGLAALCVSAPAAAGDRDDRSWNSRHDNGRHYGHQRGRFDYDNRDDRRDERRAYANGYRDGARQPQYRYGSNNRAPVYYGDPRYGYGSGYGQPVYRDANYWVGNNGRINCRRSDGSTGVIVGAVAGGTLGNILAQSGDKRVGSIIGGTLGAILGKELDKGNGRCR